MISDFFYPNMGGVENHIYHLSRCLTDRGHQVVIVTHAYPPKQPAGVITIYHGKVKVYYLPIPVMYNQCTLPTIFAPFLYYRRIFAREQVELVHGHQAFSVMCHEGILHARTIGLPVCFTDHSLFGFADTSSILTNKLLKFTLSDVKHVICVSNTSKENTVLRAALDPQSVHVIPNAIEASLYKPQPLIGDADCITVVVLSRLVYRKGIDLLTAIIPDICQHHPTVNFLIAGDGPKKIDLEQMREQHRLYTRVTLAGPVPADHVGQVLARGDIFLNCSLTEAFCMAIVEAACAGLRVVSTRVGGVPEVLPRDILCLAEPTPAALIAALNKTIADSVGERRLMTREEVTGRRQAQHERVADMYCWQDVAQRTELVYKQCTTEKDTPLVERLCRYYGAGEVAGKLFIVVAVINYALHALCDLLGY